MNNRKIIEHIKDCRSHVPDERLFQGVLAEIGRYEQTTARKDSPRRRFILKPAVLFMIIGLLVFSSLAVTAVVNDDIREYLVSIFGGNPSSVTGERVEATAESGGIVLDMDAVVAEGDSLFMLYKLLDKERNVIKDTASIDSCSVTVDGDSSFSSTRNSIIINGQENYMALQFDQPKKGRRNVTFSIESLRVPDDAATLTVAAGTEALVPDGNPGIIIDSVTLKNNRIRAEFTIRDESAYKMGYDIHVRNTLTGRTFNQKAEETSIDTQGNTKKIVWYSDELDGGAATEYVLVVPIDRIITLESPLEVSFDADFSRKPVKVIKPNGVHVLTAQVDTVKVYQLSIVAEITDKAPADDNKEGSPVRVGSENDIPFYERDPSSEGVHGQRMRIFYEDGEEADMISSSTTTIGNNRYRFYAILYGALDYSRKPVLVIGDASIPLY